MNRATSHPAAAIHPGDARRVLARHGRTFHFASRILDRATADRCARLYAFCRYLDDTADDGRDAALARDYLRHVRAVLETGCSGDPAVADFLELAASCGMPMGAARHFVDGLLSDLKAVRIRDVAALHRYYYRVAGTVGILMCYAIGDVDDRALPFAVDLGIAMQLTNIARDVVEDAELGRRYLPATVIGDVSPRQIIAAGGALRPRIARAVAWLLDEADRYYRSGESGLVYLPGRARLCIRVASRAYRHIGVGLRRRGCAVWRGREVVPTWKKIFVAADALGDDLVSASRVPAHDSALHHWLFDLPAAAT